MARSLFSLGVRVFRKECEIANNKIRCNSTAVMSNDERKHRK